MNPAETAPPLITIPVCPILDGALVNDATITRLFVERVADAVMPPAGEIEAAMRMDTTAADDGAVRPVQSLDRGWDHRRRHGRPLPRRSVRALADEVAAAALKVVGPIGSEPFFLFVRDNRP